jgi:hypothetical protein
VLLPTHRWSRVVWQRNPSPRAIRAVRSRAARSRQTRPHLNARRATVGASASVTRPQREAGARGPPRPLGGASERALVELGYLDADDGLTRAATRDAPAPTLRGAASAEHVPWRWIFGPAGP